MELYLAIDTDTHEVKMFTCFDSLKEFSIEHQYSYEYFKIGEVEPFNDVDLFYYETRGFGEYA